MPRHSISSFHRFNEAPSTRVQNAIAVYPLTELSVLLIERTQFRLLESLRSFAGGERVSLSLLNTKIIERLCRQ